MPITDPVSVRSGRPPPELDQAGYRMLSDFRYSIRRFLEFSQSAARRAGLTPRQHQALLAVKGFPENRSPTVGDLAERLRIRHHTAVGLVDRLVDAGLCARMPDAADRRRVILGLTTIAEKRLAELSAAHLDELRSLRPVLLQILDRLGDPAADPNRERGD